MMEVVTYTFNKQSATKPILTYDYHSYSALTRPIVTRPSWPYTNYKVDKKLLLQFFTSVTQVNLLNFFSNPA